MQGERRKQWNSCQGNKSIKHRTFRHHQRQFLIRFWIFRNFRVQYTGLCSHGFLPSRICWAIWHHESKATCEKTMGKIRLDQTNSPISRNSTLNNPMAQNAFCQKLTQSLQTGITLRQNRSTIHIIIINVNAARHWNRASEKNYRF